MSNDQHETGTDDTEGQAFKYRGFQPPEGAEGQDDTEGQLARSGRVADAGNEDDAEGHIAKAGRVADTEQGDDTEGHAAKIGRVDPAGQEEDTEGQLMRGRGFQPDDDNNAEAQVPGSVRGRSDDTDGQGFKVGRVADADEDDDTDGHGIRVKF